MSVEMVTRKLDIKERQMRLSFSVFTLLAVALLSSCGERKDQEIDAATAKAVQANYVQNVAGSSEGHVLCSEKTAQGHVFVLCEFSTGGYPHRGLWMAKDGKYYALNGKALGILERLPSTSFGKLPPRITVDTPRVLDLFENGPSGDEPLVVEAKLEQLSDAELQAYCMYKRQQDALSAQAGAQFGDSIENSEARDRWIEPKILQLRAQYFDANGMNYDKVFSRVLESKSRCP